MKFIAAVFAVSVMLFSCSKKKDAAKPSFKIENITGHYAGQALTWENNDNGNKTTGSDGAASFDLSMAGADKVNVTVTSSAELSQKTYQMALIGKTEDSGSGAGYIFQLLDVSGDYSVNTLLKITATSTVSATLEYTRTLKANSNISDRYKVTGFPDNK